MIKAVAGTVQKPIILLGLSAENITRLYADEPMLVKLKDIHPSLPDVQIILLAGRNEISLSNKLKKHIPGFDPEKHTTSTKEFNRATDIK